LTAVAKGERGLSHVLLGCVGAVLIAFMRPSFLLIPGLTLVLLTLFHRGRRVTVHHKVLMIAGALGGVAALAPLGVDIIGILINELERSTSDEGVAMLSQVAMSAGSGIALLTELPASIR